MWSIWKKNTFTKQLKTLFELKGADIIVESVNDIPNILNNTKKIKPPFGREAKERIALLERRTKEVSIEYKCQF